MKTFILVISIITLFSSIAIGQNSKHKIDLCLADWKFRQVGENVWYPASVPGCVHTDLRKLEIIQDHFYRDNENRQQWIGEQDWEYSTHFEVKPELLVKNCVELDFEGLDTYADVYLNDVLILKANNFFRKWVVDCKKHLKQGENRLNIIFYSSIRINSKARQTAKIPLFDDNVYTRKPAYHYGWDWGPIFVTQGVWKPIYLNFWDRSRINDVQIVQKDINIQNARLQANIEIESLLETPVSINLKSDTAKIGLQKDIILKKGKQIVSFDIDIKDPKLWWTKELGAQNLYDFCAVLTYKGSEISTKKINVGFRTIRLIQNPDSIGHTFYFELNGIPVFMKGANYIPQEMFLSKVSTQDYLGVIEQAVAANMNMLRVWGGGFYENDIFYNLCDEKGILVWQDFMFACSMYPGDTAFLNNVKQEAIENVTRLRNHPCIALWCGNNENYIGWRDWKWSNRYSKQDSAQVWHDYVELTDTILPDVVNTLSPGTFYWPSSPKYGWGYPVNTDGDSHYWGVWHAQEPFEVLAKPQNIPRFMSEFGFQGCPDYNSINKFTLLSDQSITSAVMKLHQKHRIGYPVIDKYLDWYYKKPKDFQSYLYLSQVMQAEGVGFGIEVHRRSRPHCMGTMYWQINDCYPVTSWASVDYYDSWKALHYKVRDLYKDMVISVVNDSINLNFFIISDKIQASKATLKVRTLDFNGNITFERSLPVLIKPNSSNVYYTIKKSDVLNSLQAENALIYTAIELDSKIIADKFFYLLPPKSLKLPVPDIKYTVSQSIGGYKLEISTNKLVKNLFVSFDGASGNFSDNYFDMLPGSSRTLYFTTNKHPIENPQKALRVFSLAESFLEK